MGQADAPLARRLEAFHAALLARVTPAQRHLLLRAEQRLREADATGRALRPGDAAPDLVLPDRDGRTLRLSELLAAGPAVLMFVRGGWCPYCTLTLRAYQDALPAIVRAGGQVLAVTPQPPPLCAHVAARDGVAFPILSDAGNVVADSYGVAYELDPTLHDFYRSLDHDLPRINGDWRLPLPATFVIGRDGRVLLAHVEPAPHHRLEPAAALAALERAREMVATA